LNRRDFSIEYVAPFENAALNESVRSLNVADRGDMVLYEQSGLVVRMARVQGHFVSARHDTGRFPTLMPSEKAYVYIDHGWLVWSDGNVKRELLRVPKVIGGVRVSPDGRFVAFGVDASAPAGLTHLRICELNSGTCVQGPAYDEWLPGRETFWIRK
jgi:hypothetical protein